MQMYVNYYDRYEKIEGENPTIGILLCKQSDEALVDLTLPENANIYAKEIVKLACFPGSGAKFRPGAVKVRITR